MSTSLPYTHTVLENRAEALAGLPAFDPISLNYQQTGTADCDVLPVASIGQVLTSEEMSGGHAGISGNAAERVMGLSRAGASEGVSRGYLAGEPETVYGICSGITCAKPCKSMQSVAKMEIISADKEKAVTTELTDSYGVNYWGEKRGSNPRPSEPQSGRWKA